MTAQTHKTAPKKMRRTQFVDNLRTGYCTVMVAPIM